MAEKKRGNKNGTNPIPAKKPTEPPKNPKEIVVIKSPGETIPQALAREALRPSLNAATVVDAYQKNIMGGDVDLDGLVNGLRNTCKAVNEGDMTTMEAMLIGQATALQTMFASLAKRAANQDNLKQYQTFMVLALKAQAQSRATISALVDLKYPKQGATFVKQANIANGHQQVNNGAVPTQYAQAPSSVGDFQTVPSKLLGADHERLDIGAQAAAGRDDQELGTLAAVHRA